MHVVIGSCSIVTVRRHLVVIEGLPTDQRVHVLIATLLGDASLLATVQRLVRVELSSLKTAALVRACREVS